MTSRPAADDRRLWIELDRIHTDLAQVRGAICDLADIISGRQPAPAVPAAAARRRDRHLSLVREGPS